jgi:hypothetical protein
MRNLGLFSPIAVLSRDVEQFVVARGGKAPPDCRTPGNSVILGVDPDWVYVACDTSISNACFDEEEIEDTRQQLGFDPKAYIDVHFTSTHGAFHLAEGLAREMQTIWGGTIDYSGSGGALGRPPGLECGYDV